MTIVCEEETYLEGEKMMIVHEKGNCGVLKKNFDEEAGKWMILVVQESYRERRKSASWQGVEGHRRRKSETPLAFPSSCRF